MTGSLNPTTELEVTFGQTHNFIDILPNNPKFNRAGLGLTGIPLLYPGAVQIDSPPQFVFNGGRIANGPNIGSNNAPFYNFNTTRDWSVSFAKIWGALAYLGIVAAGGLILGLVTGICLAWMFQIQAK